jgi:hypothetical protein
MSKEESLIKILDITLPFPPRVLYGYSQLNQTFTSGDLARICKIPRSTSKYYIKKLLELRLISKVPHKRMYQKYSNAVNFSSWLKDFIRFIIEPLERGELNIPEEYEG